MASNCCVLERQGRFMGAIRARRAGAYRAHYCWHGLAAAVCKTAFPFCLDRRRFVLFFILFFHFLNRELLLFRYL